MSFFYARSDDLPDALSSVMHGINDDKTVDVSGNTMHHSGLEVRLINAISRENVLKTCINGVKKNYDTVLVDCMPSLGMGYANNQCTFSY